MSPRRPRILIADDEPLLIKVLAARLTASGYEVLTASDGQDAWEIVSEHPVDLVLTDYCMPRMNGLELCRALGSSAGTRWIPVLLITGNWQDIEEQVRQMGNVVGLVRKPFGFRDLSERIAIALSVPIPNE